VHGTDCEIAHYNVGLSVDALTAEASIKCDAYFCRTTPVGELTVFFFIYEQR